MNNFSAKLILGGNPKAKGCIYLSCRLKNRVMQREEQTCVRPFSPPVQVSQVTSVPNTDLCLRGRWRAESCSASPCSLLICVSSWCCHQQIRSALCQGCRSWLVAVPCSVCMCLHFFQRPASAGLCEVLTSGIVQSMTQKGRGLGEREESLFKEL